MLTVVATPEGDDLGILAKGAQPIDVALRGAASAGIRLFVNEDRALESLAKRLKSIREDAKGARLGPISVMLMHPDLPGEVEIELGEPCPVSPQVIGALKSVRGVVHIEEY